MQDTSSNKYQVYFFLYLAVICELLIIIVERDDAEATLLKEARRLRQMTKAVVEELIRTTPVAVSTGTNQMKVGERRTFRFTVSGLGLSDDINQPPSMTIRKGGRTLDSLTFPDRIREDSTHSGDSLRTFAFDWVAPATGNYEFHGSAGTDHVSITPEGLVKIGNVILPLRQVVDIVGMDRLRTDEVIKATMFVEVISQADQLRVTAPDLVTAAGYRIHNSVGVEGTSPDKVQVRPSIGEISRGGNLLRWSNSFSRPGDYAVTLDATDNRSEGSKSATKGSFTVQVKEPLLKREIPQNVFLYETTEMDISVAGLEDMDQYAWTIEQEGRMVVRGRGVAASFKPEHEGRYVLTATYAGQVYPVAAHGQSVFSIHAGEPGYHILQATFRKGGEYPITQKFQFKASQYGRSMREWSREVDAGRIRIDAEDENGDDLLDGDPHIEVMKGVTEVTFYLKGKVSREGTDATITIRIGAITEVVPVILFRD